MLPADERPLPFFQRTTLIGMREIYAATTVDRVLTSDADQSETS